MHIDVVDVFGLEFSILECALHHEACTQTFGVRSGEVVSVCTHSSTCQFAINLSTTSLSVFEFFEDEDTSTFTHHETIAAGTEWAASACGIIIAGREGMHSIETAKTTRADSCFGTTGYHHVSFTQTNEVEGISNGIGRRSTSRGSGVVRSVESILDRDAARSYVGNHLGDEEGAETRSLFFVGKCVFSDLFFEGVNTTDAHSEPHADVVLVDSLEVHTAVLDSFHCCYECILLIEVHFADLFAVNEICCHKIFDFAGKVRFELRGVESFDGGGTAYTLEKVVPSRLNVVTNGGNCTKTGDYYSFEFHCECELR